MAGWMDVMMRAVVCLLEKAWWLAYRLLTNSLAFAVFFWAVALLLTFTATTSLLYNSLNFPHKTQLQRSDKKAVTPKTKCYYEEERPLWLPPPSVVCSSQCAWGRKTMTTVWLQTQHTALNGRKTFCNQATSPATNQPPARQPYHTIWFQNIVDCLLNSPLHPYTQAHTLTHALSANNNKQQLQVEVLQTRVATILIFMQPINCWLTLSTLTQ